MSKVYTTDTEMFFQLPEYAGKEYTLCCRRGRKLLVRLSADGRLFISKGYQWQTGVLLMDKSHSGISEMYLSTLVLDVLRQLYRINKGNFAYDKSTIHKIFMYNMKQSKVAKWKIGCYYVICKVRCQWKSLLVKWKV